MENDLWIRWISLALFAHKQSWRRATLFILIPLAPCAVLLVTLALSTRRLALVAITVTIIISRREVLVDLIVSVMSTFWTTACEALGFGCIQHLMSRCTYSTFRSISFLTIIFTGSTALVALSAAFVGVTVGGPACWAQTQTLRVFVFVLVVLICLVEQFVWCL